MFEPGACFKGAVVVFLIAGGWFHSAVAGLVFAAVPLGFMAAGLVRR